jgi:hypothetical protein
MDNFEGKEKVKEFLQFQIRRKTTNLYKQFLFILEDLEQNQNNTKESYQRSRKRVLDFGNDTIRELEECLKNLDIQIK